MKIRIIFGIGGLGWETVVSVRFDEAAVLLHQNTRPPFVVVSLLVVCFYLSSEQCETQTKGGRVILTETK